MSANGTKTNDVSASSPLPDKDGVTSGSVESPGFKELLQGMNALQDNVRSQLSISERKAVNGLVEQGQNGTVPSTSSGVRTQYEMAAQFSLLLETDWEVMDGLKLEDVSLQMEAEISSMESAALHIRLAAFATIGEFKFTISAELPNLQSGHDVEIIFTMTLTRPAAPESVASALKRITGGDDQTMPTSIVDDSLKDTLTKEPMALMLQLRVIKPAGENTSFSFHSLLFRFYAQIHWKPQLGGTDIDLELVDCDFMLLLVRDMYSIEKSAMHVIARLYGAFYIGNTKVDAAVDFTRDETASHRIRFQIRVLPNTLSAKDFLNQLPTTIKGAGQGGADKPGMLKADSVLSKLEMPRGLAILQNDLSQPNLKLELSACWTGGELGLLTLAIHARRVDRFRMPFLNMVELRDLMLRIEFQSWEVLLAGSMLLEKHTVTAEVVFLQGVGLRLRGQVQSNNQSRCSLARLARMDIFNDPKQDGAATSMDIAGFANKIKAGGNAPVDLDVGSRSSGPDIDVSFDLLVLRKPKKKKEDIKPAAGSDVQITNGKPSPGKPEEDGADDTLTKPDTPGETGGSEYEIQTIKFTSHFGLDWEIIEKVVVFESMGICFDVRYPRDSSRRVMSGLIYGTWRLSSVELFAYVLGRVDANKNEFWAGVNLKKGLEKTGEAGKHTAMQLLCDPQFTGASDLDLSVKLPAGIEAKPDQQAMEDGLEFDGRLLVHFAKDKERQKKPFKMKEISLYVDVKSVFTVAHYKMDAAASLDLRITNPKDKDKRDFSCRFRGGLEFESGIFLELEADIPMNQKKKTPEEKPQEEDDKARRQKAAETKLGLKPWARTSVTDVRRIFDDGDQGRDTKENDDIVFLARIGKRATRKDVEAAEMNYESRLSRTSAESAAPPKHEASFQSLVAGSRKSSEQSAREEIGSFVPEDYPIAQSEYQESMSFNVVGVLSRQEGADGGSKRRLKALAALLTSKKTWAIIDGKLEVRNVGLVVLLTYDKDGKPTMSGLLQGTVAFGSSICLTAQIAYDAQTKVLSLTAVADFSLSQILGGLGTEQNASPMLTGDVDKQTDLMVGIAATFKEKKLESYQLQVLSLKELPITRWLVLREIHLDIFHVKDQVKGTASTEMRIGGQLGLLADDKQTKATLNVDVISNSQELTIDIDYQNVSPASLANSLVQGGFDGADGEKAKPELPAETGFGDWTVEKPQGSSTTQVKATIVFNRDTDGSTTSRRFDFATLRVLLAGDASGDRKWELIGEFVQLSQFVLVVVFKSIEKGTEKKKKRNELTVALEAKLHLKPRKGKPAPKVPETLRLVCRKSDVALSLDFHDGCTIGDVLYCLTAGILNVPSGLDLSIFPRIELAYNWKKKTGTLTGYFEKDRGSWKTPYTDAIYIAEPCVAGTISRSGRKSARVSIKGTLVFMKFVKLHCEYVLIDGPLYIEGFNITDTVKLIRKIWNALKTALKAGRTLLSIGEAVIGTAFGVLLGDLALGGPLVLDIGGFIIGGLLAGASWLAAKLSIIKILRDLAGEENLDKDKIEQALRDALAHKEAPGEHGDDSTGGDDTRATVEILGIIDTVKKIPAGPDSSVLLTGSGTFSGLAGELVEFILEFKHDGLSGALATHILHRDLPLEMKGPVKLVVQPLGGGDAKPVEIALNTMKFGHRYRLPWKRPAGAYYITLSAPGSQFISWTVATKSKPEELISPDKSEVLIPGTALAGGNRVGFVYLRDAEGHVRQGIEEKDKISVQMKNLATSSTVRTRLRRRQNAYIIQAVEPLIEGAYAVSVAVAGAASKQSNLVVAAPRDLQRIRVEGNGLCSGTHKAQVEIHIIDTMGVLTDRDVVSVLIKSPNIEGGEDIELSETKDTHTHVAQYIRPNVDEYSVSILINNQHYPGSPFTLKNTTVRPIMDIARATLTIPKLRIPASDTQRMVVTLYDTRGGSWLRDSGEELTGWKVQLNRVFGQDDDDDDDGASSTGFSKVATWDFDPVANSPPGQRTISNFSIAEKGRYKLSLVKDLPGSAEQQHQEFSNEPATHIIVTNRRYVTSLSLSGAGLDTGYEGTQGPLEAYMRDQYDDLMPLPDGAELGITIIGGSDGTTILSANAAFNDGQLIYTRPAASSTEAPAEYFVRVWVNLPDTGGARRIVEAAGSPFLVRSAPFFKDVSQVSRSFWVPKRLGVKKSSLATLVPRDQYGGMVRSGLTMIVANTTDYGVQKVMMGQDQLYHMSFKPASDTPSLQYYIDGDMVTNTVLKLPTWQLEEQDPDKAIFILRKPGLEQRITTLSVTAQNGSEINSQDIQVIVYPASIKDKTQFFKARAVAKVGAKRVWDLMAVFKTYGDFILHPTYCGMPLSNSNNAEFDLSIHVAADTYLCSEQELPRLSASEREFVVSPANIAAYGAKFFLSAPVGNMRAGRPFGFLQDDKDSSRAGSWPKKLIFTTAVVADQYGSDEDVEIRLAKVTIIYDDTTTPINKVVYGKTPDQDYRTVSINLDGGERIGSLHIRTANGNLTSHISGLRLGTTFERMYTIPAPEVGAKGGGDEGWHDYVLPVGMTGLKGFWGRSNQGVDRLGVVWGNT